MKINFLLPCYRWSPSGGFKVVYEYANQLVARGHEVTVIHPRLLKFPPPEKMTPRKHVRKARVWLREVLSPPVIYWHPMDPRVRVLYVPNSGKRYIPDGDVLFATAWHTVQSVLNCPSEKGEKCYLIQHYETFQGPQNLVDATWRAPLFKVVVSRWLAELGQALGAHNVSYIPNGLDQQRLRVITPIANRPPRVAFMISSVGFKRSIDGVKALEMAKQRFPNLSVEAYGIDERPAFVPDWMNYRTNPPHDELVNQILNASSIVLSSSESEGFGLPPAEGAACGCAMVSTDSGGVRDFIIDGQTGLLSAPRNPEALARNLCLLLSNDDLRVRLAEAGRDCVAGFTWERSANLMETFLSNISMNNRTPISLHATMQSHQLELPRLETN
jgi:glycosyltransferase involved in cell wall biosynthesis